MNIAVFSDVHGRLLLCFAVCARWEQEHGQRIDLILQAGDLGVFPDPTRLDRATMRFAQNDPTELGFSQDFVQPQAHCEAVLRRTTCPLLFVRGNHEDHAWLDDLENQTEGSLFAVDVYRRVFCLKTAVPYVYQVGTDSITLLGIGRIAARAGERDSQQPQYIQPYEAERLNRLEHCALDVLLTHDSARDFVTLGYGMAHIRQVLDTYQPVYHFYGHTGRPFDAQMDANGFTMSCKMSDLHWDRRDQARTLEAGGMGILHWHSRDEHSFEVVDQSWWYEYNPHTWKKYV